MTLISPRNILNRYKIRPSKGLGQNFLIDKNALKKIIEAAGIKPSDVIIEIGPGLGVLTQALAKQAKTVIAIEKDPKMCEILKENLKDYNNIKIINADILKTRLACEPQPRRERSSSTGVENYKIKNYKVVANLPYYITSPVIRKFLEADNPPKLMVLMVQKEVAQRICGKPPRMSLLAVSVQFYANPEIIGYVKKQSFWPQPKVDSAILKISAFIQRKYPAFNQRFFRIVKAGFSQPRKQIASNFMKKLALSSPKGLALSLSKGVKLNKNQIINWLALNKINPTQRAESLDIKDWINLTETFPIKN
jgi:16S rRNA (adenine1518-N6/adenine1519-N6)-dimethyltransferase